MELQNLVKVKVKTLDPEAEPVQVTVASKEGLVSGEQVFKKVCEKLGLKTGSRAYFSLFENRDRPTRRYRLTDSIQQNDSDLYLGKWCFVTSQEKDMIHVDSVAAHLAFLQAQNDVQTGKFELSAEDQQKLEECLEPGFVAEDQYLLLCQKQQNYNCLCVPQCKLLNTLVAPSGTLKNGSMVCVSLSKFGVKLVADCIVTFTWFEVTQWVLDKNQSMLTLTWRPDENGEPTDIPLATPQADLLMAGILEMITLLQPFSKKGNLTSDAILTMLTKMHPSVDRFAVLLQKVDKSGAVFHAEMITVGEDGRTVWENVLYNPPQARVVKYSV